MFDKIIALFERLVIAHERLAESQEAILRVTDVRIVDDPKPEPEAKPKAPRGKKKEEPAPVEETKTEPVTPEAIEPEIKDVSWDEMKAAVLNYAVMPGKNKEMAKALIRNVGKSEKMSDITDQALINALYAAATEA